MAPRHAPVAVQAEWLMLLMGQDVDIARSAGRFTVLLVPCLLMDGTGGQGCVGGGTRSGHVACAMQCSPHSTEPPMPG